MALGDPTRASKLVRLNRARDRFRPLLEDGRLWENECEAVFSEFRVAVVHLRRESDELDAVEDKEVVWRFLCKLSRERRPFWGRCEEVLRTLMHSDQWMKAFVEDPETNLNDLPANVIKEFDARVKEVGGVPQVHVRLAIIGCGATAARHCVSIARWNERARSDFYRVVALCDPMPGRITALRESAEAATLKLHECMEVPSIEALFDKVEFDVAAFFSHNHREGVLTELFARNKFVIAEPPLAPTLEAATRLVRLSRQQPASQKLLVAERGGHWPEVLAAGESLAAGRVGEPLAAEGRAAAAGPEASELLSEGVGCTLHPGLRWVRALRRLLGPVERGCGLRRELAPPPPDGSPSAAAPPAAHAPGRSRRSVSSSETFAACLLQHATGAVSTLHLRSCCAPESGAAPPRLVVSGALGHLVVEDGLARSALGSGASGHSVPPAEERRGDGTPGGGSCAAPSQQPDGGECLWELFSRLVSPVARNVASPRSEPQEVPPDLLGNLDEHLADLAVVQALELSFQTERFEAVCGLKAED